MTYEQNLSYWSQRWVSITSNYGGDRGWNKNDHGYDILKASRIERLAIVLAIAVALIPSVHLTLSTQNAWSLLVAGFLIAVAVFLWRDNKIKTDLFKSVADYHEPVAMQDIPRPKHPDSLRFIQARLALRYTIVNLIIPHCNNLVTPLEKKTVDAYLTSVALDLSKSGRQPTEDQLEAFASQSLLAEAILDRHGYTRERLATALEKISESTRKRSS